MHNHSVSYGDQSAQLKQIRAADPDGQGRHSFTAQQQTLRRLNVTFAVYFRRIRDARGRQQRVGYPQLPQKPYQRFDQVLFVAGDGAKWEPVDSGRWANGRASRRSGGSRCTGIGRWSAGSRRCSSSGRAAAGM